MNPCPVWVAQRNVKIVVVVKGRRIRTVMSRTQHWHSDNPMWLNETKWVFKYWMMWLLWLNTPMKDIWLYSMMLNLRQTECVAERVNRTSTTIIWQCIWQMNECSWNSIRSCSTSIRLWANDKWANVQICMKTKAKKTTTGTNFKCVLHSTKCLSNLSVSTSFWACSLSPK